MVKNSIDKDVPVSPEDTAAPLSPELVQHDRPVPHHKSHWNIGRLFWGLLLVLIGGLILANNFGLVAVHWAGLWRLWPLVIIAAGLSTLSLTSWIWRILAIVLAIATLVAVAFVATGNYSVVPTVRVHEATVQRISSDIKQADITIQAGASTLRVNTADQNNIANVKLESNVADLVETSTRSGDMQRINFSMGGSNQWWIGDIRSTWTVNLTRSLPLNLAVDAGASDTVIDVSQAQLRSATVKAGASSLTLKLGDREATTAVTIDSGASSVVVQLPVASGVRLKLDGGLTTKHLADLQDVGNATYESPGYAQASKKIDIIGKVGVASFTVERY
jgi:hypothetical protein